MALLMIEDLGDLYILNSYHLGLQVESDKLGFQKEMEEVPS